MIRVMGVLLILAALVFARGSVSESKSPSWTSGEHPRLLSTAGEKAALQAKLNAAGTVSNAIWTAFESSNKKNATYDYADGAVLYWMNGDTAAGQAAITHAESFMSAYPNGLPADASSFDTNFWRYRDMLLTYDFVYDLLTAQQRQDWLEFMVLQGGICVAATPYYTPGNIHMKFNLCAYASAVLLEGEGLSITVTDEPIVHGSTNGADKILYQLNVSDIIIADSQGQSVSQYVENTDFYYRFVSGVCARCIDWAPTGGAEPTAGATYYVSYTVMPDVPGWKSISRTALENHLSYQLSDGYYNGGINSYGTVMAELYPYMMEIMKRDTGIDYSKDNSLKRFVDQFMYEKLPSNGSVTRRFNMINDTNAWSPSFWADAWNYPAGAFAAYQGWLRPFIAWGTTQYADDTEGYGERYRWLWTQAYRNTNGTIKSGPGTPDWREAWWVNDDLLGSYPVTNVPTPDWPKQRYFRGKEVVYAQTGDWGSTDQTTALMSFVAGPHNFQNEHDQGDSGSFTFYNLNEDWAVDSGYATGSAGGQLMDHNAVGIDGGGYNASGAHGVSGGVGYFGGFANFEDVVLTDGASVTKADIAGAWTLTSTPFVQYHNRHLMMINGTQTPYLIVGDDLQKDASTHSYEWYLHTGPGNSITINGSLATVTGVRTGSSMEIHSLGPNAITYSQTTTSNGNVGTRQRLRGQTTGVTNPKFFHVLLPTANGDTAPTVTGSSVTNGRMAQVDWPDGTYDVILWRTTGTTVAGGGVSTDGALTIMRFDTDDAVVGFAATDATFISYASQNYLEVHDGVEPVTVSAFGSVAGIQGTDASTVRLFAPWVSSITLEEGLEQLPATKIGNLWYINAGLPLGEMSKGAGVRYQEDFNDTLANDLFRYNMQRPPAEQFLVVNGAYELRETAWEWPSFTKRDSTPWRRAHIYPTLDPPLEHGDADYTIKFRFSDQSSATRRFRFFLRTIDREASDWNTNQDYVRIQLTAAESGGSLSQVEVGQRVNGAWSTISDNNVLTASLPTATGDFDDTNWHTLHVRLLGDSITVSVDSSELITGTLPTATPTAPASGYVQMTVVGSTPVLVDDFVVSAVDQTNPVGPTAGDLLILPDGSGNVSLTYGSGTSTDATVLVLYESASVINSDTDPATLTQKDTSTSFSGFAFTGLDRLQYHAVSIRDTSGNESLLLPLSADVTAPEAVTDLNTQ